MLTTVMAEAPLVPALSLAQRCDLALELEPKPELEWGWPLLAAPVPTDRPAPVSDAVEQLVSLDAHLVRNPDRTFLVRAHGDALAGSGIHDGDLLVVDRALPPTAGSIVVAAINGQFALRRCRRDAEGRRVLCSVHPALPDQPLGMESTPAIWGVVRWAIHRVWPGREWVD